MSPGWENMPMSDFNSIELDTAGNGVLLRWFSMLLFGTVGMQLRLLCHLNTLFWICK